MFNLKNINKIFYMLVRITTILLILLSLVGIIRGQDNTGFGDYIFVLINASILLVATFIPYYLRSQKIEVPNLVSNVFLAFVTMALLFGEILAFYVHVKHWDSILHFSSGILIGIVGFSLISLLNDGEKTKMKLSPLFVVIFAFCFTMTVGVVWEIFEFAVDEFFGANMQRAIGEDGIPLVGRAALFDTMKDFILNTLGALLMSVIGYFDLKRQSNIIKKLQIRKVENKDH